MAECSLAELMAEACANGFSCAAQNTPTLEALRLQLLCNIQENGESGFGQQVFGGNTEPNIIPTVSFAIWIMTTDDTLRLWHSGSWH